MSSTATSSRHGPTTVPQAANSTAEPDEERGFHFFFDFKDYWCAPLGDAFDITARSIKRLTSEILLDCWHTPFRGEFTEDARHVHELYERGHYTHGGEYPIEDDLNFYLALHGLYELAGHLIANLPVIIHTGHEQSEWEDFLQPHVPTRTDGRWLADRRDPAPIVTVREPDYQPRPPDSVEVRWGDEWKYEISNTDFDTRLAPAPGWISLWQRSYAGAYSGSETVGIHSALVTPESGPALLRALQTAPDARAFRIPSADDDDYQFDVAGHQLIGWIRDPNYRREGCDRRDPRARGISFLPPAPTEEIAAILGASADHDLRSWRIGDRESLQSLVWDETEPASRERGSSGDRLIIRDTDLTELLRRLDRSLIVEVMISRDAKITVPQRLLPKDLDDDDLRYTPYTKYFLFDQHGSRHHL